MSSHRHPLELEVLTSLNHYLSKKNKNLESCPLVFVPQTIVYEHNFPTVWYQQNPATKEFKKKSGKELETKAIMNEFTRNIVVPRSGTGASGDQQDPNAAATTQTQATPAVDPNNPAASNENVMNNDNHHGIVAQFISQTEDEKTGEIINNVEFLDVDSLDDFLFKRKKRDKGILQQFITPKGPYNFVIQAIWSPHVTKIERRVNIHRITDRKNYSPYERAVTYEGPSHFSNEVFCAPHLEKEIKRVCSAIVDHFFSVEHKNITRMVLYFKVDPKNNLYLLWSSSIRIGNQKNDKPIVTVNNGNTLTPPKREPLNLSPKFNYNHFDSQEEKDGSKSKDDYGDVLDKIDSKKPKKAKSSKVDTTQSLAMTENSFDFSTRDEFDNNDGNNDCDRDEEFQKIKQDLQQELDDLLYLAYSHFLHNSEIEEQTMEFPFLMPPILLKAFGEESTLVQLFSNRDLNLTRDEREDGVYILSLKQASSMNKLQHEFTTFKEYLMECFESEGYYESNFKVQE
ncbi:predicted protein [Naegleria gruberi]|uniref:Predicted protein n=1 Tax=Naegleria gruberi TaxID=5762 RepID=D2W120_NAEGR|nr:uncharacterized protein NAEGRDRAFT_59812 [Naegleria gruberi]EFC37238.1 predicted protein [Naegleria gruberi]|eukprot:XP_002669982.1 predicted protein [Naegleria gruberi strain NEG-M]